MPFSYIKSLFSIFVILLFITSTPTAGQGYITKQDGGWTSANTWNRTVAGCSQNLSGPIPPFNKNSGCAVDIIIQHRITYSGNIMDFGNGLVNGLELSPGASLTVNGDLQLPASGWGSITYLKLGEGSSLTVSGTLALGKTAEIAIPKNTTVIVGNLVVDDNSPKITVEEGAELIVLNQTIIKAQRTLVVKGKFATNTLIANSGYLNSSGSGSVDIENNLILNSGELVFSGNSALVVGGNLETSGSASLTLKNNSTGKMGNHITLVGSAHINVEEKGFLSANGDLRLEGGAKFNLKDSAEGLIGGDVRLDWNQYSPNGTVTTSASSKLYIDGKLVAGRTGGQLNALGESKIYICDYPNSTPVESPMTIVQSNSYYGPGCGKLPVDWMEVKVVNTETAKNSITWATAKEWESSHFEIERSSNGIDNFEKIGEISGIGWSNSITLYSFDDKNLYNLSGNLYYRIKQVDFNGNFEYSDVIALKLINRQPDVLEWKAYPNPSTGSNLKVLLTNFAFSSNDYVDMRMMSSSTQSEPVRVKYGNDLDLEISRAFAKAPRGIVIIELVWNEKVSHLKIIKN